MKFNVNQQDLQQALNYCQGVIEKRSTLPILSNVLSSISFFTIISLKPEVKVDALFLKPILNLSKIPIII